MSATSLPAPARAAIALGSNLGDRSAHIAFAAQELAAHPCIRGFRLSPIIQTAPVSSLGTDAGGPYLNAAAIFSTTLLPRDLLNLLHDLELARGRDRPREARWGPRTLDLDLLVHGQLLLNEPGLTIPHPRLHERLFVLQPLASIAPDLPIPSRGRAIDLYTHLLKLPQSQPHSHAMCSPTQAKTS